VRKLPSGRYQASYLGPDGRRHSAPETFERKPDASQWLAGMETEIAQGEWRDPQAAEQFLTRNRLRSLSKNNAVHARHARFDYPHHLLVA